MDVGVNGVNGAGGRSADMWSRGTKRPADHDSPNDWERFEKRLRMLSIRRTTLPHHHVHTTDSDQGNANQRHDAAKNSHLYHPVTTHPAPPAPSPTLSAQHRHPPRSQCDDDMMALDATPNRVYIHDLDAELADTDTDDPDRLIFLPDIEAKLSRLPPQVLNRGSGEDDHDGQELVLYSVPKSLTVDESHDSVRRAIIEARQRAREKALLEEEARAGDMEKRYDHSLHDYNAEAETAHGYGTGYEEEVVDEDPDAMDIG